MNNNPTDNPYGAPSAEPSLQDGHVSDLAIDLLRRTKGWVMFLAVLGYIGTAFMLLTALGLIVGGSFASSTDMAALPFSLTAMGVAYLIIAAVYVYPCVKLNQYSNSIKRLLNSRVSVDLETALDKQRAFWKFAGIFAIIMLIMYVGLIVFMMIGGVAAAQM